MAIVQEITGSQTALCGSILVEDTTLYSTVSPDTRADWGIALFTNVNPGSGTFTNDPSLSDLTNPGIIGLMGTWDIDIPNSITQEYEVIAFWCPLWISGAYNENDIIFHAGDASFYRKTATGTGTETPGTGLEWTIMDGTNYTEFLSASLLANPIVVPVYIYESVTACPPYKVLFKECDNIFRIIDNSENQNNKRYTITYYDGTAVEEEIVMQDDYVDIALPEDHIYILTIEEETTPGYWEEVAKLPIYAYCKLKTCAVYLIDSVLCNDYDPCCTNCDSEEIVKKTRQRQQINQLLFMYGSLLSYIHEESIEYIGMIDMSADRLTYMERIDNLFVKIKNVLERCELCAGAWQSTTNQTTTQGDYKPCNC